MTTDGCRSRSTLRSAITSNRGINARNMIPAAVAPDFTTRVFTGEVLSSQTLCHRASRVDGRRMSVYTGPLLIAARKSQIVTKVRPRYARPAVARRARFGCPSMMAAGMVTRHAVPSRPRLLWLSAAVDDRTIASKLKGHPPWLCAQRATTWSWPCPIRRRGDPHGRRVPPMVTWRK